MSSRRNLVAITIAIGAGVLVSCEEEKSFNTVVTRSGNTLAKNILLPSGLDEISGLALASNTSVYAHNDEHGIVYEIDIETGDIIKAFALGRPTAKDDFEGIAGREGRIYLLTSNGRIYEAPIGVHGERVVFHIYDTGLEERCEFEGLVTSDEPGGFLLLCKQSAPTEPENALNIFKWSLETRETPERPWMSVPLKPLLSEEEVLSFRPSALEVRADGGLVVISAVNRLLVDVDADGILTNKRYLDVDLHPQSEGVTILPNGTLVIADEGARVGRGRITIYDNVY